MVLLSSKPQGRKEHTFPSRSFVLHERVGGAWWGTRSAHPGNWGAWATEAPSLHTLPLGL